MGTYFEEYCRDRFDFTRSTARYLIGAAEVVNNLKCEQIVNTFPTKESQCRPLHGLTPELQREVWLEAVKKANGKVPSARIVKSVLEHDRGKMVDRHSSSKKSRNSTIEYEHLKDYQVKKKLPTLNSAIANLLELLRSDREEKLRLR